MRIRIGRTLLVSAAVLLCAAALTLVPRAGLARSPRPGTASIFDEILHADPGEDPHLRVEPQIRVEPIGELGTAPPPSADASGRDLLGKDAPLARGARTGCSRGYSKFIAMLRFFLATTVPR